jgi:hypothetical protein
MAETILASAEQFIWCNARLLERRQFAFLFQDGAAAAVGTALRAYQNDDGGWPITWPAVSPLCELEYRGVVTIQALKTLQAYGRLSVEP